MKTKFIVIAAVSTNLAIGKDNKLLWDLPEDLKRFRALTMGFPIIMGRKTYESIGKPLPGRTNIVITRNPDYNPHPDVHVVRSVEDAIFLSGFAEKAFIIGGAEIYAQAECYVDELELTIVKDIFEADAFFPKSYHSKDWKEVSRVVNIAANGIEYDFVRCVRSK